MAKTHKSPWPILLAIASAVLFGTWAGQDKTLFGIPYYSLLDVAGGMFINAFMLVVVPIVSSSIITGVARIGNEKSFGRLGAKTFAFYLGTSLFAILIGLFFVNLFSPGISHSTAGAEAAAQNHLAKPQIAQPQMQTLFALLLQIVPSNIILAFSQGQMLGIIFFSLFFGYALSKIESQASALLMTFWQGIFQTMLKITQILMNVLPYGVFCLVAKVFASSGIGSISSLALFATTVILSLAVFMFIGLPLLLKLIAKVSPIAHFKAMSPALITAFSTSSSSATLPITIECVEKRAGVSNRICSLVVPLGATVNMAGSALYECVAAMFIAQAYGLDLSFTSQFLIVLIALVTSMGIAGVPSGGLIAVIVILKVIGLPPEGIGLFIAVDRLLDMCRTTVNVFSDSCCAILVARSEGENVLSGKEKG